MGEHGRTHHNNIRNADGIVVITDLQRKLQNPLDGVEKETRNKGTSSQLCVTKYELRMSAREKDANHEFEMATTDI